MIPAGAEKMRSGGAWGRMERRLRVKLRKTREAVGYVSGKKKEGQETSGT